MSDFWDVWKMNVEATIWGKTSSGKRILMKLLGENSPI